MPMPRIPQAIETGYSQHMIAKVFWGSPLLQDH